MIFAMPTTCVCVHCLRSLHQHQPRMIDLDPARTYIDKTILRSGAITLVTMPGAGCQGCPGACCLARTPSFSS